MEQTRARIRVVLRWIQILNTKEPVWRDRAQFCFRAQVTAADMTISRRFPDRGHYEITDQPPWNRVVLNRGIYEGDAGGRVIIQLTGEELDRVTEDDPLDDYRRVFTGSPHDWTGVYEESMRNWRICYAIEAV